MFPIPPTPLFYLSCIYCYMEKIVKLSESQLNKIIKRIVIESSELDYDESYLNDFKNADDYAGELYYRMDNEIQDVLGEVLKNINLEQIILKYQNKFISKYGQYSNIGDDIYNDNITSLMQIGNNGINYDDMIGDVSGKILDYL